VGTDASFCDVCGSAVAGAASVFATVAQAAPTHSGPIAERRLVSVLFADLVGFTSYSEGRDAEEVRDLLSRYFDTCRTLIERYGGVVEKFIGDAVMAVWGAPAATEDDADRAVRAALELTQAVQALGTEIGHGDLRARAGVLTGEAAVTIGASAQGMVAGDLVNTASRIQSIAEPGTVLVGEATRRATEASVVYEDAGTHELKGKAEPVALWRALRVVAGTRGSLKSEGLEAPFVGRDRELRLVKEQFHAAAEDRRAFLVSVIGMAGIGKSRTVWEFYKYMEGLQDLYRWHRGRCLSYGEGVAYWALAEMVRGRAGILEAEEAASSTAKLHASVQEHVPDPEEQRWVEPRLAHLIGLEERTAAEREDLFAAWRLFFERMAERQPVVMSFEDMQWADASLLDFVEYLLEWSRNSPIFILTLARPELLDRRPTWGAGKRNFTSIFLEPLAPDAMTQLLDGLVPGLPDAVAQAILARAEGVPLYAVETVRMLIDRGLLVREGSAYRPTGTIESLEVPETLHALIAARLDGLSGEERRLLQDAAVLGKTFTKHALAALGDHSPGELEALLSSLVRREVLSLQADPRSPERGQYGFLQDLVRTVAYETLSKRDRKARHLAVAAYLEEAWGVEEDEIVEIVASHLLHAYQADPSAADAAEIKARVCTMLTRAAERASSLAAAQEALGYLEQVIELVEEPLQQAELHERAGREAWRLGRASLARSHFDRATSMFESMGLTHPAARVVVAVSQISSQEGRLEEAVERMESAFATLSTEEPDADLALAAAELGRLHYFTGRTQVALERVEFALGVAESLRLLEVFSQALQTKGNILGALGRVEEGATLLRKALDVALDNDFASAALRAYNNLSAALGDLDRYEEASGYSSAALDMARRVGDRVAELGHLAARGSHASMIGRWDEALAAAAEVLQNADVPEAMVLDLFAVVMVSIHRGELDEAERLFARVPDAAVSKDVQTRSFLLAFKAGLLLAQGKPSEALVAAEGAYAGRDQLGIVNQVVKEGLVQAIEAAFVLGDLGKVEALLGEIEALLPGELTPYLQAHGARAGARLAAIRDEDERVGPGFQAAATLFREIPVPFWLAVTLLEHGEWLVAQGSSDEAGPLMDEATSTFERLKARPWLARAAAGRTPAISA